MPVTPNRHLVKRRIFSWLTNKVVATRQASNTSSNFPAAHAVRNSIHTAMMTAAGAHPSLNEAHQRALGFETMPFGYLLPGTVNDLRPVTFGVLDLVADFNSTYDLIPRHSIPVVDDEFQSDAVKRRSSADWCRGAAWRRQVEGERFVEDRIQRSFLNMRLLLGNPLSVVQEIHFDIWVCACVHTHASGLAPVCCIYCTCI
jgi:hypothetical protein